MTYTMWYPAWESWREANTTPVTISLRDAHRAHQNKHNKVIRKKDNIVHSVVVGGDSLYLPFIALRVSAAVYLYWVYSERCSVAFFFTKKARSESAFLLFWRSVDHILACRRSPLWPPAPSAAAEKLNLAFHDQIIMSSNDIAKKHYSRITKGKWYTFLRYMLFVEHQITEMSISGTKIYRLCQNDYIWMTESWHDTSITQPLKVSTTYLAIVSWITLVWITLVWITLLCCG